MFFYDFPFFYGNPAGAGRQGVPKIQSLNIAIKVRREGAMAKMAKMVTTTRVK
jgi:hypothetical protein